MGTECKNIGEDCYDVKHKVLRDEFCCENMVCHLSPPNYNTFAHCGPDITCKNIVDTEENITERECSLDEINAENQNLSSCSQCKMENEECFNKCTKKFDDDKCCGNLKCEPAAIYDE